MSQLLISSSSGGDFYLNVLAFRSPIFTQMSSAQTKSQIQYFPIKAFQPEIRFSLIFPNETIYQQFQQYVRNNQVDAQSNTTNPGVTLNWPQRSINNWQGVITGFKAGGMRSNYAPRAELTVDLTSSLVTELTSFSSFGTSFMAIFGAGTVDGVLQIPSEVNSLISTVATGVGIIFGGGASITDSAPAQAAATALSAIQQQIPGL